MQKIKKVRSFTNKKDFDDETIIRVNNSVLRKLGGRNSWVKIKSESSEIYRLAKGVPSNMEPFYPDNIELDYDSQQTLRGENQNKKDKDGWYKCDYEISTCSKFEVAKAHWCHPNQMYQVPYRISIVSFILGVLSIVLSVI